jgi:predicted P-loop ATPase
MGSDKKSTKGVCDYLAALIWDQQPRIDRWLVDYAGAEDTPYVRAVGRAVLVAAVRRARMPGTTFDGMLILEGPQGIGKTAALRILAVETSWFGDDLPTNDARQLLEATAGKWIVEAAELRTLGLEDVAALKACLSRTTDEARLAYDTKMTSVPRQFVVVGTTSATDYLRDSTGARRLWPVRVARFALERLRVDRDQLWAEAAVTERLGESLFDLVDRVAAAWMLAGGES